MSDLVGTQIVVFLTHRLNSLVAIADKSACFNPYLTSGLSNGYHSDESTFVFRGVRSDFHFYSIFR